MEENIAKKSKSHFFKVIMPGFHEKLNLPLAFCKKLKLKKSEEDAILKSCKGTWKIKMCRDSQGLICFKQGWPQFALHHSLSVGDFLVFKHSGDLHHFNVSVFDPSCCEKEFVSEGNESVVEYQSRNPYFMMTMKPGHASRHGLVTIPAEFVRSNDLKEKTGAKLIDPRGRRWAVKLSVQRAPNCRVRMRIGWHEFYESNQLKVGDVCVLDLNPRTRSSTTMLFHVKIFKT